jgi:hypothetical protein
MTPQEKIRQFVNKARHPEAKDYEKLLEKIKFEKGSLILRVTRANYGNPDGSEYGATTYSLLTVMDRIDNILYCKYYEDDDIEMIEIDLDEALDEFTVCPEIHRYDSDVIFYDINHNIVKVEDCKIINDYYSEESMEYSYEEDGVVYYLHGDLLKKRIENLYSVQQLELFLKKELLVHQELLLEQQKLVNEYKDTLDCYKSNEITLHFHQCRMDAEVVILPYSYGKTITILDIYWALNKNRDIEDCYKLTIFGKNVRFEHHTGIDIIIENVINLDGTPAVLDLLDGMYEKDELDLIYQKIIKLINL